MWGFCEGQKSMSCGISFHLTFWCTVSLNMGLTLPDKLAGRPQQWSSCLFSALGLSYSAGLFILAQEIWAHVFFLHESHLLNYLRCQPSSIFFLTTRQIAGWWMSKIPGCVPFRGFPWLAAPTCNPTELRKLFSNLLVSAAYLSKIFPLVAWPVTFTRINHLLVLPLATVCPWPLSAHPNSPINISRSFPALPPPQLCPSYSYSCDVFDHNQMDTHFCIFCTWTCNTSSFFPFALSNQLLTFLRVGSLTEDSYSVLLLKVLLHKTQL